ncbi:MAG: hypothetical protein ACFE9Q_17050 [Candidatus Hodarchaeota archaeon]
MEKRTIPLLIMLGLFIVLIIIAIIAAVFDVPVIALNEPEISIASFDYWTIAHFLWGVSLFVIAFTIGWIVKNRTGSPKDPINEPEFKSFVLYWIIIMIIAGAWELIENTILYLVDIKVKFDSAANILTDITIWGIGGSVSWYMTDLMFLSDKYLRAYYIYGFMCLTMGLIIFIAFGFAFTNY